MVVLSFGGELEYIRTRTLYLFNSQPNEDTINRKVNRLAYGKSFFFSSVVAHQLMECRDLRCAFDARLKSVAIAAATAAAAVHNVQCVRQ